MLKVKNLNYNVGAVKILNGVDFEVSEGEIVGIIGPNGSGKTTLFNCLSGFNQVSKGNIFFKGGNITKIAAYNRAKLGIGRVFQSFGIFKEMTLEENIVTAIESNQSFWSTFFPWSKQHKENEKQAHKYLQSIGLRAKAHQKANSLSGGQMRLLEITRSLAFGAKMFLLDEPTAGVSPKMKDDVEKIIKDLKKSGKTVLIIEHDINFIQKFCDRIIVLDVGKVVMDDKPEKVRKSKKLREIYFGSFA